MIDNKSLHLIDIPINPGKVTRVIIDYDFGADAYNVTIQRDKDATKYEGIYFDQLADIIANQIDVKKLKQHCKL